MKFTNPFPHLVVDGFLPADLYARTRAALAQATAGEAHVSNSMQFGCEAWSAISAGHAALWGEISDHLQRALTIADDEFGGVVRSERRWFSPDADLSDTYDVFAIFDRKKGFAIGPHVDGDDVLWSILIYLPADDSAADHGLDLYEIMGPYDARAVLRERGPAGAHVEVTKSIEYLPNRMIAIPGTSRALHGNRPFSIPSRPMILAHRRIETRR